MKLVILICAGAIALSVSACETVSNAQTTPATVGRSPASAPSGQQPASVLTQERGARLEAAFSKFEYRLVGGETVGGVSDVDSVIWAMNWQKEMLERHRNPAFIASGYAHNLWRSRQLSNSIKEASAVWFLASQYLISLKGLECQDPTSSPERLREVLAEFPVELKNYVDSLSRLDWLKIASSALRIASDRAVFDAPGDDWICRAGVTAYAWQAGFDALPAGVPPDLALAAKISSTRKREDYRPTFRKKAEFQTEFLQKYATIQDSIVFDSLPRKE
ncbi:MAG: hypothetical protein ACOVVK_00320 [Elsteraceae bacterium]